LQDQNHSKIQQIDKKFFFGQNNKNTILNDKPNCQVSKILMNPRLIYVKRSENESFTKDVQGKY
jgi:hypothetical protein